MTIETRMSFPTGGTECPPDENPLPASSITTTTPPTFREISTGDTCSTSSAHQNLLNAGNKDDEDISIPQRLKLRSNKCSAVLQDSKSEEPSKQTFQPITSDDNCNSAFAEDEKCTNSTSTSPLRSEKAEDLNLKKPNKAKPLSGDGIKEEAASRKSMRLRLRRADNLDEIFGLKERPRYVEDLTSIDFDNDNLKIMFMDALGMTLRSKRVKLEPAPGIQPSYRPSQKKEKILHPEKKVECAVSGTDAVLGKAGPVESSLVAQNQELLQSRINGGSETRTEIPLPTTIRKSIIVHDDDDDDGWECWVKRLTTYVAKPVKTSPTKNEIKESLIRLSQLGTAVTIVNPGLS